MALEDCCDLGQGFQLAERDMAIRGIGSLFGEQQSGDAAKIGIDLYFEMLLEGLSKVRAPVTLVRVAGTCQRVVLTCEELSVGILYSRLDWES